MKISLEITHLREDRQSARIVLLTAYHTIDKKEDPAITIESAIVCDQKRVVVSLSFTVVSESTFIQRLTVFQDLICQ